MGILGRYVRRVELWEGGIFANGSDAIEAQGQGGICDHCAGERGYLDGGIASRTAVP